MALLLILFVLFGLVLGGFGSGSSSSSSGSGEIRPAVKCSKRITTDQQPSPKCGPPPANP
jgi:hypothetical protein